ncbi:MAG: hydroxyacid dehydrogenase [Pseudobdellovibrio sp.]
MTASKSAQKKILICERFSVEANIQLKKNSKFDLVLIKSEAHFNEEIKTADGLIIRSKQKITANVLEHAKHLEVIVTCTSGYDHIDLIETKKRNITVMYTPEANQISAAELTWGLVMACARNIVNGHRDIKSNKWVREPHIGFELSGKTFGLVGLGRIGSRVAKFANAFGMTVLAFDPYQDDDTFTAAKATRASYEELLKQSDLISFHVPATKETKSMFNRTHYEFVHPEVVLINTSRGSVINEEDLAEALLQKKIRAAGLDVFEKEPLSIDSKLMKCTNVVMTPHLGAFTEEAFTKASLQGAKQIENYFDLNQIENALPLENNWGSLSFQERT